MNNFMDKFAELGGKAVNNKYLGSIRDAFTAFMPLTIIGAIGTLWSYVIVNESSGLGAFFKPVMALQFLNPAFNALNFCTIGCISIIIAFAIGYELGEREKMGGLFCGMTAAAALLAVTNTTQVLDSITVTLADGTSTTLIEALASGTTLSSLSAISTGVLGSQGLFTAMLVSIFSVEVLAFFNRFDSLKIKMPDSVPPNIAGSFNVLIPGFLTLIVVCFISLGCVNFTGYYLNDLVFNFIQSPLTHVVGSYFGGLIFILIITLLWCVGIHGNNVCGGVLDPMMLVLLTENMDLVNNGQKAANILNSSFWACFVTICGTGIAGAMTIAIFIAGKREDNRAIAKIAAAPNCFNINEVNVFGIPVVLNPVMCVGFVLAPMACYTVGYVLTYIGFCPKMYILVPWTTPAIISGFLASGGDIRGAITQALAIAAAVVVWIPCVKAYEKQQNAADRAQNSEK